MSNTVTTGKVLILTASGRLFEVKEVDQITDALDDYIKEVLGFENRFSVSEEVWKRLKDDAIQSALASNTNLSIRDVIKLVNGLCKTPSRAIARVITGNYTIISANPVISNIGNVDKDDFEEKFEEGSTGIYLKAGEAYLKVLPETSETPPNQSNGDSNQNAGSTPEIILGDVDGNGKLESDDAIYLLYNVLFGEEAYPLNQPADFDGNGVVDSDDAIHLLYHVLFGAADYPLHSQKGDISNFVEDTQIKVELSHGEARPGETKLLDVVLSDAPKAKAMAFELIDLPEGITFDANSSSWECNNRICDFTESRGQGNWMTTDSSGTDINKKVLSLAFKVAKDIDPGEYSINLKYSIITASNSALTVSSSNITAGSITVIN
jgi:hypothetical protein